jgi:CubicO group peptidase (beta-lactamase class C family)
MLLDIINLSAKFVGNKTLPDSNGIPQLPTLALGVVTPKFTKTLTFGKKPDGQKPTELDIYPISSITKVLTGLIAARGVANNEFNQNTPVRYLLKSDLASLVGNRTVGELVSHRAGYKPKPANLRYKEFPNSPGTNYSRLELIECLQNEQCSVVPFPSGTYVYSDISIGLLAVALTDFYNKPYEQLLTEKLTDELGMNDTHTRSFVTDEPRIIQGFATDRLRVPPATMGILAGSGEVLSTGRDMLILLKTLLNPPAQWEKALQIATTPVSTGTRIAYAIDIVQTHPATLLAKSGNQAGYSSLIMWSPELRSGTFALTNVGWSSKTLKLLLDEVLKVICNFTVVTTGSRRTNQGR